MHQRRKRRKRPVRHEHAEQVLLYQWATQMSVLVPELDLLFAIPNEIRTKNVWATLDMRSEGLKSGVLDNFLPVARRGYHGMWIEMKYGRNYLSENQIAWAVALIEQGYRVDVHYSFEAARDALCDYLGIEARFL